MSQFSIAPSRMIHWTTAAGYRASGLLVMPIDYHQGARYPLVIQTYPTYEGGFVCDSGESHDPSTAPQPLAGTGIMYLLRSRSPDAYGKSDANYYSEGYPGGIGEAAFQMDLTDSAVKELANEGVVDPDRVGIVGFSRSGWYTLFTLTHSKIQYRAATVADGTHYSLGDYWLLHSDLMLTPSDAMYGGPPYGESLQNWLKYSISFNLDKIHTPLLLEAMGNGTHYDNLNAPPLTVARMFELLTALHRLHRPVELYFYPNEGHQPDHPRARLATIQRNLDWYRFWLQNHSNVDNINIVPDLDPKGANNHANQFQKK
jgi:dipeptidyl aminopeptidase/acylaminoacyl peptidase